MLKFDSFIWGQFCKFIKLNTVNSFLFPFCLFVLLWSLKKILFKFFLQPVHCFHFSFPKSFRSPASQKNKMCTVKITLRTYRQDKAISCYPQSWEKFILVFASLTFVCCSCLFSPPCSKLINSLILCGSGHHPKGHVSGLLKHSCSLALLPSNYNSLVRMTFQCCCCTS